MHFIKTTVLLFISLTIISGCQQSKKPKATKQEKEITKVKSPEFNRDLYFQAALEGNLSVIQKGLEAGLDVNIADKDGHTGLILASFNGHNEIVELLIQNKALVNLPNTNRRTALMLASSGPFNEIVTMLLNAGADPNIVDSVEEFSALMFAAAEGQLEVVKTLVNNGADKTLKDIDGDTAYDFAIEKGHTNVAEFLKN